jgi:hypothetical protein
MMPSLSPWQTIKKRHTSFSRMLGSGWGNNLFLSLVHLALSRHFKHGQSTASCVCILASGDWKHCIGQLHFIVLHICFVFWWQGVRGSFHITSSKDEAKGPKKFARILAFIFSLRSPVTSRTAAAEHSWFGIAYSITYY